MWVEDIQEGLCLWRFVAGFEDHVAGGETSHPTKPTVNDIFRTNNGGAELHCIRGDTFMKQYEHTTVDIWAPN